MENKKSEALRNHPRICFHPIWFVKKKSIEQKINMETYGERMKNTKNITERKRNFCNCHVEMVSTGEKCVRKIELPY